MAVANQSVVRRVVFRVDASVRGGMGHLRRCAVLGRHLKSRGVQSFFAVRAPDVDAGFEVGDFATDCRVLPKDVSGTLDAEWTAAWCRDVGADRLVIDHYDADEPYQKALHAQGVRWLQFDGATALPLWADWVLSTVPAIPESEFLPRGRRPGIRWLIGPRYAILREEFMRSRPPRVIPREARRLLLCFGGGDDYGANEVCLEALRQIGWTAPVDLAVGSGCPALGTLRRIADSRLSFPLHLHVDANDMADLLSSADLAIIAGGTTTFEAAAMGTPTLMIRTVPNQLPNTSGWQKLGAGIDLGDVSELVPAIVGEQVRSVAADCARRTAMTAAGTAQVDGHGPERILDALCAPIQPSPDDAT